MIDAETECVRERRGKRVARLANRQLADEIGAMVGLGTPSAKLHLVKYANAFVQAVPPHIDTLEGALQVFIYPNAEYPGG